MVIDVHYTFSTRDLQFTTAEVYLPQSVRIPAQVPSPAHFPGVPHPKRRYRAYDVGKGGSSESMDLRPAPRHNFVCCIELADADVPEVPRGQVAHVELCMRARVPGMQVLQLIRFAPVEVCEGFSIGVCCFQS